MQPQDDTTGKQARRGPMAMVYTVMAVGIIAIIGYQYLSDDAPQDQVPAPTQPVN